MVGGFAAAISIVLFVTAHEAGHFLAAKAVGMKATQFFFGFGPKIWSTQKGETEYGFKWLPLGGYVRIIGMNPLEEVEPGDMGRTYREKKFWEKSVVVLAGVGMNFLIAFLLFYGIVLANGVPGELVPEAATVVDGSPAEAAGMMEGDTILAVNGEPVVEWVDMTEALAAAGAGPADITVMRDDETIEMVADLDPVAQVGSVTPGSAIAAAGMKQGDRVVEYNGQEVVVWDDFIEAQAAAGPGTATLVAVGDIEGQPTLLSAEVSQTDSGVEAGGGFLGIAPAREQVTVGPIESIGYAGQLVWEGIFDTLSALFTMIRPSSIVQYLGVFAGNTDVPLEIRPVSPVGIVGIGSQVTSASFFIGILAQVNVILATINLLPLFPLDGGHFALAFYERITGREADIRRLVPVAAVVIGLFAFLGFVAIVLDVANPINL